MFRNIGNFKLKGRNVPEELNLKQHRRQTHKSRKLWQRRIAPQGSQRTPATCIAATTPELTVEILNSVF